MNPEESKYIFIIIILLFLVGIWNWIQLFQINSLESEIDYLLSNQRNLFDIANLSVVNINKIVKNQNQILGKIYPETCIIGGEEQGILKNGTKSKRRRNLE